MMVKEGLEDRVITPNYTNLYDLSLVIYRVRKMYNISDKAFNLLNYLHIYPNSRMYQVHRGTINSDAHYKTTYRCIDSLVANGYLEVTGYDRKYSCFGLTDKGLGVLNDVLGHFYD